MEWHVVRESELSEVADYLAARLPENPVLAFQGDLGAGKTTLIQYLCKRLGVTDAVSSPTFSLVNEYCTPQGEPVFHFDFYRIESETEALDMGYEEYLFSQRICLVEWPEKIDSLLPKPVRWVVLDRLPDESRVIKTYVE